MTFPPNYHDPFAAVPPDVVAAIEEQCGMPFAEAAEKYCGPPVLCPSGNYLAFAHPPGCGREHFAAVAEVYRRLLERWGQQERAPRVTEVKAVPRLDATSAKPRRRQRTPRRPTLASVAKQANKAALDVARYEVKPDGTVVVVTGQPEPVEPGNPWSPDEFRTKETKQ